MTDAEQAWEVFQEADVLYTPEQVEAALDDMAHDIAAELSDKNPILICVMNGGLMVTAQLALRLKFPLQMDYLQATRYRGQTQGGEEVHWLARPQSDLKDRHVLIIDDILDEGHTLVAIQHECLKAGPASVRTAVLLKKDHERCHKDAHADFIGLHVTDRYVFGSGMDYKDHLRNLPGIYALKEQD
jgi:hypoxanthine phosphoribosyltransferase